MVIGYVVRLESLRVDFDLREHRSPVFASLVSFSAGVDSVIVSGV